MQFRFKRYDFSKYIRIISETPYQYKVWVRHGGRLILYKHCIRKNKNLDRELGITYKKDLAYCLLSWHLCAIDTPYWAIS